MKKIFILFTLLFFPIIIFSQAKIIDVIQVNSFTDTNETDRVNLLILENQSIWDKIKTYFTKEDMENNFYNKTQTVEVFSEQKDIYDEDRLYTDLFNKLNDNYYTKSETYNSDEFDTLLNESLQTSPSFPYLTKEVDEYFLLNETREVIIEGYDFTPNSTIEGLEDDGYTLNIISKSPTKFIYNITSPSFITNKTEYSFSGSNNWNSSKKLLFQTQDPNPSNENVDNDDYDPNTDYEELDPISYTSPYSTWQTISEDEYNDLRNALVVRGHTTTMLESVSTGAYTRNYGTMSKTNSQRVDANRIIYAIKFRAKDSNSASVFSLGLANINGVVEKIGSNSVSHTTPSETRPYVYIAGPGLENNLGDYKYLAIANTGGGMAVTNQIDKTNYNALNGNTITVGVDLDMLTYDAVPYELLTN